MNFPQSYRSVELQRHEYKFRKVYHPQYIQHVSARRVIKGHERQGWRIREDKKSRDKRLDSCCCAEVNESPGPD